MLGAPLESSRNTAGSPRQTRGADTDHEVVEDMFIILELKVKRRENLHLSVENKELHRQYFSRSRFLGCHVCRMESNFLQRLLSWHCLKAIGQKSFSSDLVCLLLSISKKLGQMKCYDI